MFTKEDAISIVEACRLKTRNITKQDKPVSIPELKIELVYPPEDFLGAKGNPAIFVNKNTFHLFKNVHRGTWRENETIVMRATFLQSDPLNIIGALIHEVGHAYNVAASQPNTEMNAYLFEINMMIYLFNTGNPILSQFSKNDMDHYFESRLKYYNLASTGKRDDYLDHLILGIENHTVYDWSLTTFDHIQANV